MLVNNIFFVSLRFWSFHATGSTHCYHHPLSPSILVCCRAGSCTEEFKATQQIHLGQLAEKGPGEEVKAGRERAMLEGDGSSCHRQSRLTSQHAVTRRIDLFPVSKSHRQRSSPPDGGRALHCSQALEIISLVETTDQDYFPLSPRVLLMGN